MPAALPKHNVSGVARQGRPPKLSRALLKWLSKRGDPRLVATLLELESAFHDGMEAVTCSLEQLDDAHRANTHSRSRAGTRTSGNCVFDSNEIHCAASIPEGDCVDSVCKFLSGAIDQLFAEAQERSGLEPALILSTLAQVVTEKRWKVGAPVKMREIEGEVVLAALRANGGDRSRTAAELGVGRRRLDYRLKSGARSRRTAGAL